MPHFFAPAINAPSIARPPPPWEILDLMQFILQVNFWLTMVKMGCQYLHVQDHGELSQKDTLLWYWSQQRITPVLWNNLLSQTSPNDSTSLISLLEGGYKSSNHTDRQTHIHKHTH